MANIERVLFATDFSDIAREAEDTVTKMVEKNDWQLQLVHVFDVDAFQLPAPYHFMPGSDKWLDDRIEKVREHGRQELTALCGKCGNAQGHLLEGKPGQQIVDLAEREGIDLIILGTHGYKGFNRLMLGSVAEFVLRQAKCGVLVLKPQAVS